MMPKKPKKNLLNFILIMCLSFWNLGAQDLQEHKWKHRILIIKTTDEHSKIYQAQLNEFKNSEQEQIQRKFVVYQITGETYEMVDFKNSTPNKSGSITKEFAEATLTKNKNFEIILLGLDGGVKLHQTSLLTKEELYQIVDSMPMRSAEIKSKRSDN